MAANLWLMTPPAWWPLKWWPFATSSVDPADIAHLVLYCTIPAALLVGAGTGATRTLRSGYAVTIDGDMPVTVQKNIHGATKITEVV